MASSAATADDGWPADAVEVGRIVGAWGVKGWIKVQPHADDPQALHSSRRWHLRPPEAPPGATPPVPRPAASPPIPERLRIVESRDHGEFVVARVRDVDERSAAEALRGARVHIARSSFPTPGDGEYYWVDLIGLAVVNREGVPLGRVAGLIETGAHAVLRVVPEGEGGERLIPFVSAYVDVVEREAGRIRVDWGADY